MQRALSPYAEIITPAEGNVATAVHELIDQQKVSTIVLADIGKLVPGTQEELERLAQGGGILVRFAGPRLEQGGDELLPVPLRRGGRSLGGSLSWSTPQPLAPFEEKSPFRGLAVPDDVKVNRQVLADPTMASDAEVWATLADGTPLVTAAKQGQGYIVLFHVTANSDWSNLPLSGLFVEMLRRIVTLGPSQVTLGDADKAADARSRAASRNRPRRLLDRASADPDARRLRPAHARRRSAPRRSPPTRSTRPCPAPTIRPAITARPARPTPSTSSPPRPSSSRSRRSMPPARERLHAQEAARARAWLYLAALALFAVDVLAVLMLSTGLRLGAAVAATSAVILLALTLLPQMPPRV